MNVGPLVFGVRVLVAFALSAGSSAMVVCSSAAAERDPKSVGESAVPSVQKNADSGIQAKLAAARNRDLAANRAEVLRTIEAGRYVPLAELEATFGKRAAPGKARVTSSLPWPQQVALAERLARIGKPERAAAALGDAKQQRQVELGILSNAPEASGARATVQRELARLGQSETAMKARAQAEVHSTGRRSERRAVKGSPRQPGAGSNK